MNRRLLLIPIAFLLIAAAGIGPALIQATSIELGAAGTTDTTITRVSAGVVAVEGVTFLTTSTGQPLDADLTSWAGVTRASGFDTFTATPSMANLGSLLTDDASGWIAFGTTPSSANLDSLVTDDTGSGALVFGTSPTFTTSILVADETVDIGTSSVGINDIHFGSGGIVNFDGGDCLITHSANTLTLSGCDGAGFAPEAGGITSVVEDESPQLGGDLDLNSFAIFDATMTLEAGVYAIEGGFEFSVTDDGAAGPILAFHHNSTSAADGDIAVDLRVRAGADDEEVARIALEVDDGSTTTEDTRWRIFNDVAGSSVESLIVTGALVTAAGAITATTTVTGADVTATDDVTVGDDLLLPDTGLITWNSTDCVLTHSANLLALTGACAVTSDNNITAVDVTTTDDLISGDDVTLTAADGVISIGADVTLTRVDASDSLVIQADADNDAASTVLSLGVDGNGEALLSGTAFYPGADGGNALGIADSNEWNGLHLNSATAIAWANSDVTITHSANDLAFAGVTGDYSFDDSVFVVGVVDASTDVDAGGDLIAGDDALLTDDIQFGGGDVIIGYSANALAFSGVTGNYSFDDQVDVTGAVVASTDLTATAGDVTSGDDIIVGDDVNLIEGASLAWDTTDCVLTQTGNSLDTSGCTISLVSVAGSMANLGTALSDEAAGWITFGTTPSMANLGTLLTDDAAGWITFGTTPSSANLDTLVTDDTGSGELVFATTPTLVTPVIGAATGTSLAASSFLTAGFSDSSPGTGNLGIDDQGSLFFFEAEANGDHSFAFVMPASFTGDVTCTFENDGNPIPDSCVGDGSDAGGAGDDATGKQTMWIPASATTPNVTSGAGYSTYDSGSNDLTVVTADFDTGATEERIDWQIGMPAQWNEGTLTAQAIVTCTACSAAETIQFEFSCVAISHDDTMNAAMGTPTTTAATVTAANDQHTTTESSATTCGGTPAAGDLVAFRLARDTSGDNAAGDARLIGIKVYWTNDAAKDD
jgi:hypothetical protein